MSAEQELEALRREAALNLRGGASEATALLELAQKLAAFNDFGLARKLLAKARGHPEALTSTKQRNKFVTRHALYTYKDADEPLVRRLERALEILAETEPPLSETRDQEALGIAGAIHKRKWEADGQRIHLERALGFYQRGWSEGVANDFGYTAINAAYILDCLAAQETSAAEMSQMNSETAARRKEKAQEIRKEILRVLPPLVTKPENDWLGKEWWYYATLAEAAFGTGAYEEAATWLDQAKQIKVQPWQFESTARQLAALARLQDSDAPGSAGAAVIRRFTESDAGTESILLGKVGLALSGGGFRASIFHIGVLARLAELDLLRSVEVISCVSGGSIIGAHYYLEVKQLLETKSDREITRDDYIAIVQRISEQFVAGVQTNIRTRIAAEWLTNVRMIFDSKYSRTHRAGELYESELFSRVNGIEKTKPLKMRDLIIEPKGESAPFTPKYENWRRHAKVPLLILNSTTLNTGHNWQFTATFMGEPPGAIDPTVDGNDRLRRMWYKDAPPPYNDGGVRLGHAVAASAGVPGLFEPLSLTNLYDKFTVRLVDGGVHDNQGVSGLLEQDATFLIVSDASGQMAVQPQPSPGLIGVPLRSNSILMSRVREAQAKELRTRRRSGLLRAFLFMHLKRDLEVDPRDWINCPDPYDASDEARPIERRGRLTSYRIRKDVQRLVSALRTDLDAFNDLECCALMTSGYRMTECEAKEQAPALHRECAPRQNWNFLAPVERQMDLTEQSGPEVDRLFKVLSVGQQLAFKTWLLYKPLRWLAVVLALVSIVIGIWAAWRFWNTSLLTVGNVAMFIAIFVATALVGKTVMKIVNFPAEVRRILRALALALGGCLLARLHLWIFNPLFLKAGRVRR